MGIHCQADAGADLTQTKAESEDNTGPEVKISQNSNELINFEIFEDSFFQIAAYSLFRGGETGEW